MKRLKLLMILMGLVAIAAIYGCEKGAMEKAGESMDEAADDAGDAMRKAGNEIEDAVSK